MNPTRPITRMTTVNPRGARRAVGFTLIEVMVSLFILAVLAGAAWKGVDAISTARQVADDNLQTTLRLQSVMTQLDADMAQVYDTQVVKGFQFDGANLRFTRRASGGVQVVVWSLREGSLWRWESPAVRTVQDLQAQRDSGIQQLAQRNPALRAFDGVAGWQFACFWTNAWANCQSTGNTASVGPANPNATTQPPSGLRIAMQFAEGSGLNGTLTRELEVTVR